MILMNYMIFAVKKIPWFQNKLYFNPSSAKTEIRFTWHKIDRNWSEEWDESAGKWGSKQFNVFSSTKTNHKTR